MKFIMNLWNRWKEICDEHNEDIDYINQDDYWDYTEFPTIILLMLFFLSLMYIVYNI